MPYAPDENTIGLFVEADDEAAAISAANGILDRIGAAFTGYLPSNLRAVKAKDAFAQQAVARLWGMQETVYREHLPQILAVLILGLDTDGHFTANIQDLLEDLDFRTRCYQVGTPEGWPVRLYDPFGMGVIWRSSVLMLMKGCPTNGVPLYDLERFWLVLVQMETKST